ncbi:MAG: GvpL/GvpF family gas vesicle protein [Acidobacteriia bacterium]|nr:GvpL/GvpF family gas vesicle protein [Terriglobia bacterium]
MSTSHTTLARAGEKHAIHLPTAAARTYLYAVVGNTGEEKYGEFGIDGSDVYSIPSGKVAAVVSNLAVERVRPERARLAAHQEVLKRLLVHTTPLPMSFGVLADSPQAIRKMLSRNQQMLLEQLRRVEGKVEMGLRISWDVPNIFEYFVITHEELRQARDQLLGGPREPTQEDKIEVGRLFDRLLNDDRQSHLELVDEILSRRDTEVMQLNCRSEREVLNVACLVKRESTPQFEADVFEVAKHFDNNFALNYNGPWAPHNFVEASVQF